MPQNKEVFDQNFQQLAIELDELNSKFESTIQNAKHKNILVTHSAFSYWEQRYGIKEISISGLSSTNMKIMRTTGMETLIHMYGLTPFIPKRNGSSHSRYLS